MSLGTTNPYHAVWPVFGGNSGFGDCSCNAAGGAFYDILALGGGHGGDDASLTRDFATPPRLLFLVGEFEEMIDRLWNDDTVAPSWRSTTVQTARIAKIWTRDTGEGVYHPQIDQLFAESSGFTSAPVALRRNWQDVGTGGNPPCEIFVYGGGSLYAAPASLTWSVPQRVISGTTYAAESISSPAHKLLIGGASWKGEDYFISPATSFRFPSYGTPGSTHANACPVPAFQAGKRAGDRELLFPNATGGGATPAMHTYDASGAAALSWAIPGGFCFAARPRPLLDYWMLGGVTNVGVYGSPPIQNEVANVTLSAVAAVPSIPMGADGGFAATVDCLVLPPATNYGGSYVAGDTFLLRTDYFLGSTFDWDAYGNAADLTGGARLDGDCALRTGLDFNLTNSTNNSQRLFDTDASGRVYFGGTVTALDGVSCDANQLYRVNNNGGSPVQLGTFSKNGVAGTVLGFVVICDPVYGGSGIASGVVVGDFDTYTPPAGASSTTPKTGLSGILVLSLRDSQSIAQQEFWGGRFSAGTVVVNTGDWLPGMVLPA